MSLSPYIYFGTQCVRADWTPGRCVVATCGARYNDEPGPAWGLVWMTQTEPQTTVDGVAEAPEKRYLCPMHSKKMVQAGRAEVLGKLRATNTRVETEAEGGEEPVQ